MPRLSHRLVCAVSLARKPDRGKPRKERIEQRLALLRRLCAGKLRNWPLGGEHFRRKALEQFWSQFVDDGTTLAIQILDVLVVAYLIYRLLLLVRGSRAWRILGGIVIYMLFWFLSGLFGLRTLHFILDKALILGPVALVILLLPELRSALEGFGKLGFWPGRFGGGEEPTRAATIEEIVSGVAELSAGNMGALIVIERSRQMPEIERTGVSVDAAVSAAMLIQLFFDRTPLHDGAVLIRGDRIVAAACQLPLSEGKLPPHMHLRHRAAVGITEQTDAIAIVVSEERGTISAAIDGRIRETMTPNDLRDLLKSNLLETGRPVWGRKARLEKRIKTHDEEVPV